MHRSRIFVHPLKQGLVKTFPNQPAIHYVYRKHSKYMSTLRGAAPAGMNYDAVRKAAAVLRAVNHPIRQRVLRLLDDNQRVNATDIGVRMRLEKAITSQHLRILRDADAVTTRREGKEIYYGLNASRLAQIAALTAHIASE